MKTTVTIALVLGLLASTNLRAEEPAWSVDPMHSRVDFVARHLMITKVTGTFHEFAGTVVANAEGRLESVEGTVQVKSLDTNVAKRDEHLKSPDFFDADKFPTISFKSDAVKLKGDEVTVVGDLTMKGVTKKVTFKGQYLGKRLVNFGTGDQLRVGYEFTGRVNRKDFGLNFDMMADGAAVVSEMIDLDLSLEIVKDVK
jgi:polyisoprenoid-binding protein YceI